MKIYSATEPVLINPNFIRHLSDEQLKVVGAILACNQNRSSFPTDKTIAFFGGFNDIQIVQKIKKSLEDIGLLKNDMTLDLDWGIKKL